MELTFQTFRGVIGFPVDTIWCKSIPSKVCGFLWQVTHGRILTIDNLRRRGFQFPNRCIMCESEEESIWHLFFDCRFVRQIWILLSSRLSLFGPIPGSVAGVVAAWKGLNWEKDLEVCGRLLMHAVLWCVWKERNSRTFRDKHESWERVLGRVGRMTVEWGGERRWTSEPSRRRWLALFRPPRAPD
ncbi:hypothetical protein LINPERHAP1_LOCUS35747 [Linum perenne]